jgi:hypothetical protein
MRKGGFIEGEHPRDGGGRFTNGSGNNGKPHRNNTRLLTVAELKFFIDGSLKDRKAPYKRVIIGRIEKDAQARIEAAYGEKVNIIDIDIDNHSIYHAIANLNHNLVPEDILLAVDVINTSTNITQSNEEHQDNDVLIFKKDIDGEIIFLTEVRVKNGYLLVFDAWMQKKARSRKRSDAAGGSPELTSKTSFPRNGLSSLSPKAGEKSSKG